MPKGKLLVYNRLQPFEFQKRPQLAAGRRLGYKRMFDLVEELKRVRQLAEQDENEVVLYLIDMAIVEASAIARALKVNVAVAKKAYEPHLRIV